MAIHPKAKQNIDRYVASAPEFARPICHRLRELIHKADPGIVEDWKWGPNFNRQGMVCGFGAFKEHVTLAFFKGALLEDPKKLLVDCSGSNAHNRSLKFRSVRDIDEKTLIAYVREAAKLNEEGAQGERRRAEIPLPADLKAALAKDKEAKKAFLELTPGYRREYLEWVVQAKRPETRAARIETTVKQSREGKTLHYKYQR
jgi:uncharacterized protein YdeI (YjbR/CyaY-like superfamily)